MSPPTAQDVATAARATVTGRWYRHCPAKFAREALSGWRANGRWSSRSGFPVLYLGEPVDAVVIEADRHLVDPVEGPIPPLAPRVLVTCPSTSTGSSISGAPRHAGRSGSHSRS